MKTPSLLLSAAIACMGLFNLCLQPAAADAGPVGEWRIQDGSANVEIKPCGGDLCGFVSWTKVGAGLVGREVLVNMRPNGRIWSGTAVNVLNGQTYAARMSLRNERILKIEGCLVGGMICGGQNWSRVK